MYLKSQSRETLFLLGIHASLKRGIETIFVVLAIALDVP